MRSYNLGRLYAARGETDLAVREWRRAVAVDPEHQAAITALAGAGSAGDNTVAARAPGSIPNKPASRATLPSQDRTGTLRSLTVDSVTYALLQRARAARDRSRNSDAVVAYRQVLARMGGYFPPAKP